MALAYTSCAGCSAAVKGLLQRPMEELRLVNAVVEEHDGSGGSGAGGGRGGGGKGRSKGDLRLLGNGGNGGSGNGSGGRSEGSACGHGCGNHHNHQHLHQAPPATAAASETTGGSSCGNSCGSSCGGSASTAPGGLPRALCLREAYLTDRARLDQLLETFPLEPLMKKVQPRGVGLRCEIHRRNGGQAISEGWEWEDAWDRLPADMRLKVAAIDVDALEAAMHQATSTHRFCADCKHNVVTAFDILTCKCDLADIDNEDEFLPDLFWPFAGRIGPVPGDVTGQKAILSCPLEDVEELICWHEDFDSREYTRSSQRHAATLEHGQREIRSIVGSVLLTQLRTNYHNHLAQVQGEQYLFALVLQAIRTRVEGGPADGCSGGGGGGGNGKGGGKKNKKAAWLAGFGDRRPSSSCPGCGGAADPGCPICGGTGVSLSELGFVDDDDKKAKTKSKKKRERKARAKAAKKSQEEEEEAAAAMAMAMAMAKAAEIKAAEGKAKGKAKAGKAKEGCNNNNNNKNRNAIGNSNGSSGSGNGSSGNSSNGNHDHQVENGRVGAKAGEQRRGGHHLNSLNSNGTNRQGSNANSAAKRPKTTAKAAAAAAAVAAAAAARQNAGSTGIEMSAGSLLSMLDNVNGDMHPRVGGGGSGGNGGGGRGFDDDLDGEDYFGDDGIDEEIVKEMERLKVAQTDVQRSRAALRSNLQKNFDQLLLVSSSSTSSAPSRSVYRKNGGKT
ncbi:unnamed protein product [Scytosiphon promiscuus]